MSAGERSVWADVLLRMSLWVSFPINPGAAYVLARPSSWPGRQLGLPAAVDPLYAALGAYLAALFGCVYAWLALQKKPVQPLLAVGAIAKCGFFVITLGFWLFAGASLGLLLAGGGDLLLAALWLWWLNKPAPTLA